MESNGLKYFWKNLYLLFGLFNKVANSQKKVWENSASFMKKDEMIMTLHKIKKTSAPFFFRNVIPLRYYSLKMVSSIYLDYQHLLEPKLEVNSQLHALILLLLLKFFLKQNSEPYYKISCQRWSFIAALITNIYYSSTLLWYPENFKNCIEM